MIANTNYVDAFYDNNKELKNKEMKKDKQIHIRVSDSEMTAIKEKSLKNGLTVTDYIKKSCGIVCETSEEVIQREQEELDRFIDSQKEIDKLYSDYYYNPCETLEEQVEIKQKELEEFENFSYCESLEEVRQREQEELKDYEFLQFEQSTEEYMSDLEKRIKDGNLEDWEINIYIRHTEETIDYYEEKIEELKKELVRFSEYERVPYYGIP